MTKELTAYHHKLRRERNKAYVRSIRENGLCVDCGTPENLEFDHLPGFAKFMDISTLVSKHYSRGKIEAEIAKCALRCRPCHQRVTWERLIGHTGEPIHERLLQAR